MRIIGRQAPTFWIGSTTVARFRDLKLGRACGFSCDDDISRAIARGEGVFFMLRRLECSTMIVSSNKFQKSQADISASKTPAIVT